MNTFKIDPPLYTVLVAHIVDGNAAMNRKQAKEVFDKAILGLKDGCDLLLDFSGLKHVMFGFMDELAYRLIMHLGPEKFSLRVRYNVPDAYPGLREFILNYTTKIKRELTSIS